MPSGGTVSKMGLKSRGRIAARVGTVLGAVTLLAAAADGQMGMLLKYQWFMSLESDFASM